MADGQINIPPPQQLQAPNQVAQGGTSQTNTALPSPPTGTVLQGFIINRDTSGNPILRTSSGDVPFSTNFFLKIGSEVVIRVGNASGNNTAQLISVDGQAPEEAENLSSFAQQPEVILSPQLSQSLATNPLANTAANAQALASDATITVTGTVIAQPQAAQAQASLTQTPVVSNGTQLSLKIVSISSPNAAPTEVPENLTVTNATLTQATSAFYATYAKAAGISPQIQEPTTPTPPTTEPTATNTTPAPPTTPAQTQTPAQANSPTNTTTTPIPLQPSVPEETPIPANAAPPATTPTTPIPTTNAATPQEPIIPVPTATTTTVTQLPPTTAAQAPTTAAPTTQPTASPLQPGTTLNATVIGHDTTGETLVQSPVGLVRLQAGTTVPSGSTVTFQVLQATPPTTQNIPTASLTAQQPAPIIELAQQWSSLQQIFAALTGRSTPTGLDETPTPSTNAPVINAENTQSSGANVTAQTITSSLFSFISALRTGDFENWLGAGNIAALKNQGQDDLLKKTQGEFTELAQQFTQAPANHWQPLFFPLPADGTTQQVRIFVKRDRKGNQQSGDSKDEDTRFVVEMDLSQLGEMQMDGFVRRQDKNLQFDMIIRSMSSLPSDLQNDILKIYNDMGAITGYNGSVTFQSVKSFPVNPMEEIVAAHRAVMA